MPPRLHLITNPLAASRQAASARTISSATACCCSSSRLISSRPTGSVTLSRRPRPLASPATTSFASPRYLQRRLDSTLAGETEAEGTASISQDTPTEEASVGETKVKKTRKSRKKAEDGEPTEGEASTPKKRISRKKKDAETAESEPAAAEEPPKRRGRPKKKEAETVEGGSPAEGETPAPKKRASRKKKDAETAEGELLVEEETPKRKRGRPKKTEGDTTNTKRKLRQKDAAAGKAIDVPYKNTYRKLGKAAEDISGFLPYRDEVSPEKLQAELASDNPYVWPHLPEPEQWKFTGLRVVKPGFLGKSRYFICNRFTARSIVDSIDLAGIVRDNGGQKVTIVEAFPGPGTLTRELLMRDEVGKIIALEEQKQYLPWLEGLKDDPTAVDPQGVSASEKLHVIAKNGYFWKNYDEVQADGLLDDLKSHKDQTTEEAVRLSPLVFVSQMPNSVHGDQLYVQLLTAMSTGQWLFQYGRVKLVTMIPEALAQKSVARACSFERAKLGATASVLAAQQTLIPNEPDLFPAAAHMYPPIVQAGKRSFAVRYINNENFASGDRNQPLCVHTIAPRARQVLAWRKAHGIVDPEDHPSLQPLRDAASAAKDLEAQMTVDQTKQAMVQFKGKPPTSGLRTSLLKGQYLETSTVFPTRGLTGVEFESMDYLMRNLFATRVAPLKDALARTYPGAAGILRKLEPEGGWEAVDAAEKAAAAESEAEVASEVEGEEAVDAAEKAAAAESEGEVEGEEVGEAAAAAKAESEAEVASEEASKGKEATEGKKVSKGKKKAESEPFKLPAPAPVYLTARGDVAVRPDKLVKDLTDDEWISVARIFEKWPFRPEHLFEEGRAAEKSSHQGPDFSEKYGRGARA